MDSTQQNKLENFKYLRLDTRNLSLFRIVLGISLLCNLLWVRLDYITEFWGANSIIPPAIFQQLNGSDSFSIFDIIRNDIFAYGYFGLLISFTILYTIGFQTRWIAPLTCFLYWNILQSTSSFVFGFDFYTFQMLFWSCFLPLNHHFSVQKPAQYTQANLIFCLILLYQISWVYFATGWAKYGVSWSGGYAVHNMLMDKWATTSLGQWLANATWFYVPTTWISLAMERLFPLFIFLPFGFTRLRWIVVLFLLGFHLSIFATYYAANFSITGIAVAILLLPNTFWQWNWIQKKVILPTTTSTFIQLDRFKKYASYTLVSLAFLVITQKNIFFCAKHTAWRESNSAQYLLNQLSFLDIPAPIKISFFTQFWKMFAPNPPTKAGWLALEIQKEDGLTYDYFTNKLITQEPTLHWTPSGYEYYLMLYARNFDVPNGTGEKFKLWLKYWLAYTLLKHDGHLGNLDKVFLTDYLYIVADQSKPHIPLITFNLYKGREIVEQDIQQLKLKNFPQPNLD